MINIKHCIIILFSSQLLLSQDYDFYSWQGLSGSTSDNLDAIHLNPAGLGVNRSKISGFALKQTLDNDGKVSNNYFVSIATRYASGFAIENYYNGKFNTSVGYGTEIFNNIYFGASYHSGDNYTVGMLLRPSNVFSFGFSKHEQNNSDVSFNKGSFAIRPFEFINLKESVFVCDIRDSRV